MAAVPSRPAPVQKFKPTQGAALGYVALAVAAAVVVTLLVTEPGLTGVRFALGISVVSVVVWAALVRQRATAYADTLVLHHMFSDTHLPLARIDTVVVRQMLFVWIGDERYACAGIGSSTRKLMKRRSRGPMAFFGVEQADDKMGMGQLAGMGTADYVSFVETRIEDLARSARRDQRGEPPPVRRSWAVPELTVLGVLGVAFAVSLLAF